MSDASQAGAFAWRRKGSPSESGEAIGFGMAIVAVIVAGFGSSLAGVLLGGLASAYGSAGGSLLLSSVLGAFLGAYVLRMFLTYTGYDISYVAGVISLLLGDLISIAAPTIVSRALAHAGPGQAAPFIPVLGGGLGFAMGIVGLLLSAVVVQACAVSARPAFTAPRLPDVAPSIDAPPVSTPTEEGYTQLLGHARQAVNEITSSLFHCPFSDLPGRVYEALASLRALTVEIEATIPPTQQVEGPQGLLVQGLRQLQDDLVIVVQRAESRGEGERPRSLDLPDRLADLESGDGLATVQRALELLRAQGFGGGT